jgi:hypothetical protein
MAAVEAGDARRVAQQLQSGVDPNAHADGDNSPLIRAAEDGHNEIAALLISAGAEVDYENDAGDTPLNCAAAGGSDDIVAQLLAAGASFYTKNRFGATPIRYGSEHPKVVRLFIHAAKAAKNPDALDEALEGATEAGTEQEMVPLLCELIQEDWHLHHEDFASTLQGLKDPRAADSLATAALMKFDYLAYNDSHAFARKCVWALADIGSDNARNHLIALADNPDEEIAAYAKRRLARWDEELDRKRFRS